MFHRALENQQRKLKHLQIQILKRFKDLFLGCVCDKYSSALEGQKRALDPLELELQAAVNHKHRCWELNSGPLQEQQLLLTTGPVLQPLPTIFLKQGLNVAQASLEFTMQMRMSLNFSLSCFPLSSAGVPGTTRTVCFYAVLGWSPGLHIC